MEVETPVPEYLPNAVAAIVDAFGVLEMSRAHVKPDRSRFALIGHSTGGMLSVQVAALAKSQGLPEPKAVVAVTPGEVLRTKGPSLADVPAETLLVVVAAEHDVVTGDGDARRIYREATSLPPSRKKFVLYRTDLRGRPRLWADHLAPTASHADFDTGDGPFRQIQMNGGSVNAIDREGFWKVADVTLAAGFAGKTLDEALAGVSFRRLGYWSDGRAVLPPIITNDPTTLPRVVPSHGFRLVPFPAIEFRSGTSGFVPRLTLSSADPTMPGTGMRHAPRLTLIRGARVQWNPWNAHSPAWTRIWSTRPSGRTCITA